MASASTKDIDSLTDNINQLQISQESDSRRLVVRDTKVFLHIPLIPEIVHSIKCESPDPEALEKTFLQKLKVVYSPCVLSEIEISTRGQADNDLWFLFRKFRITASKVYGFYTAQNSVENAKEKSPQTVANRLKDIDGSAHFPKTTAMKYGNDNEPKVREMYLNKLIKDGHQNPKIEECGLFVSDKYQFLGVSPDGVISCDCCGVRLLEIKCPYRCKNPDFKLKNLEYMVSNGNTMKLDRRLTAPFHYHCQIQMQMAVCKVSKSVFVVWSPHEPLHVEEIDFDQTFWNPIEAKVVELYLKSLLPLM